MRIEFLNTDIPDEWFDTKTPEEIKDYLDTTFNTISWVCPMLDGHIVFGSEVDWEALHDE